MGSFRFLAMAFGPSMNTCMNELNNHFEKNVPINHFKMVVEKLSNLFVQKNCKSYTKKN